MPEKDTLISRVLHEAYIMGKKRKLLPVYKRYYCGYEAG